MIIPVRCFTCGTVLGDKYRFYQQKVFEMKEGKEVDTSGVEYFSTSKKEKTVEGRTLDAMGLTKMCCRRHMLTHVDIH